MRLVVHFFPYTMVAKFIYHQSIHQHGVQYSCPSLAGPNDALSPEALQAMMLGSEAVSKSRVIRQELYTAIDRTKFSQQAAHASVNEGITRKLAQTVTLTVSAKKSTCSQLVCTVNTFLLWLFHRREIVV